tara:strand:+ start:85 stop:1008 length:924 start_codon:yes stop_codon:yes gene_type:complete
VGPDDVVTQLVYAGDDASSDVDQTITGAINGLIPDVAYVITVEVLRSDLASGHEYVKSIVVGGNEMGACHPDGGDYDCTFSNSCPALSTTVVASSIGDASVLMVFTGHSKDCNCDLTNGQINTAGFDGACLSETDSAGATFTPIKAAARFTAAPATYVSTSPPAVTEAGACEQAAFGFTGSDVEYASSKCVTSGSGFYQGATVGHTREATLTVKAVGTLYFTKFGILASSSPGNNVVPADYLDIKGTKYSGTTKPVGIAVDVGDSVIWKVRASLSSLPFLDVAAFSSARSSFSQISMTLIPPYVRVL